MKRSSINESLWSRVAAMGFLILLTIYFLIPVYWLVLAATKNQGDLISTNGFWLGNSVQLAANLGDLFSRDGGIFVKWAGNSIVYAGGGALVGTTISLLAGYALAKFAFRGREVLFSVILGGVLLPSTALALPLFLLFAEAGLTDSYWAVLLPSIVSPFGVYLARIFAGSAVPDEMLEAARLDGAGEFRTFFSVVVRILSPSIVTVFLFQFVAIWNNFFLPMVMLQSRSKFPITLGLYFWNSQSSRYPGMQQMIIAGSLVSIIPLIIVFLSLQRFWRAGLAAGSIK